MSALVVAVVLLVAAVLAWPTGRPRVRPAAPGPEPARPVAASRGRTDRGAAVPDDPSPGAPASGDVAEVARLLAVVLRGGAGVVEALDVVARHGPPAARVTLRRVVAAHRWGRPAREAWDGAGERWAVVADALVAAEDAGLAPVRALEVAAQQVERGRRARSDAAVRRLEVLVVLPLGLAFLPGFVLTTVVPLVVVLARGALAS